MWEGARGVVVAEAEITSYEHSFSFKKGFRAMEYVVRAYPKEASQGPDRLPTAQ